MRPLAGGGCLLVLLALAEARVFLSQQHASEYLVRKRRANSFMEESKKGNLERECVEELCNKEEAREIFENDPETEYFYPKYIRCLTYTRLGISSVSVMSPDSSSDLRTCVTDWDECMLRPNICGTAKCQNTPGKYECVCAEGFRYNSTTKNCEDVDECAENICAQMCVNYEGSYTCHCDGHKGFKLSQDMKTCEAVPVCLPLNLEPNYQLLYLAEQTTENAVLHLRFKLPNASRFSAEFDFRTYDNEGVILYAESSNNTGWFLLALRDGKIEIQFKNEHGTKVTSGGKAINDGVWQTISVEELEHSICVKIAREAVMSIKSPGNLFKQINGSLEIKVYVAGLPPKVGNTLIKQINPRIDGCARALNLMSQGHLGLTEVIKKTQIKRCLPSVGKGSYYPGTGVAKFHINYNNDTNTGEWVINVALNIRPSKGTGVMFALVSGESVPLALSIVDSSSPNSQAIVVTVGNIIIARLESKRFCTTRRTLVGFSASKQQIELTVDSQTDVTNSEQELSILDQAMRGAVAVYTYLGGLPDLPLGITPLTVFYNGCMEAKVNSKELDLDQAAYKHSDIRSHSCPQAHFLATGSLPFMKWDPKPSCFRLFKSGLTFKVLLADSYRNLRSSRNYPPVVKDKSLSRKGLYISTAVTSQKDQLFVNMLLRATWSGVIFQPLSEFSWKEMAKVLEVSDLSQLYKQDAGARDWLTKGIKKESSRFLRPLGTG
ncbi:vitamin K-dependent protein S precursor isoform A [Alligator mississippiensis]|uniref:Vitamin K-dependent protein S n=1 Tax=Alligator mississippiensis TaxID=8496 RepID=A0A151MD64_ALLMI|nr:vitamin K-dependent protein S precursor isoform A [Alligator mississippiensis]